MLDKRMGVETEACGGQFVFMKGQSTMNAVFALGHVMEKYRENQSGLHMAFIDFEKA